MGDLDAEFALFESEVAALEAEVCAFVFFESVRCPPSSLFATRSIP